MILGHPTMEVDLVMILHLVRKSDTHVTQVIRLQEAGEEPAQSQVHGVGVRLLAQVSLLCRQTGKN